MKYSRDRNGDEDYAGLKPKRNSEFDVDGAEIIRPDQKVIIFNPGLGYSEALTFDNLAMIKRVEEASKVVVSKKPKKTVLKKKPNKAEK